MFYTTLQNNDKYDIYIYIYSFILILAPHCDSPAGLWVMHLRLYQNKMDSFYKYT